MGLPPAASTDAPFAMWQAKSIVIENEAMLLHLESGTQAAFVLLGLSASLQEGAEKALSKLVNTHVVESIGSRPDLSRVHMTVMSLDVDVMGDANILGLLNDCCMEIPRSQSKKELSVALEHNVSSHLLLADVDLTWKPTLPRDYLSCLMLMCRKLTEFSEQYHQYSPEAQAHLRTMLGQERTAIVGGDWSPEKTAVAQGREGSSGERRALAEGACLSKDDLAAFTPPSIRYALLSQVTQVNRTDVLDFLRQYPDKKLVLDFKSDAVADGSSNMLESFKKELEGLGSADKQLLSRLYCFSVDMPANVLSACNYMMSLPEFHFYPWVDVLTKLSKYPPGADPQQWIQSQDQPLAPISTRKR